MYQEWPRQTKPKKGQFMNFSQGHSGTKVRDVNRACFPKEKRPEFTKNGRNSNELFVLALSLVWFAGATPECNVIFYIHNGFRINYVIVFCQMALILGQSSILNHCWEQETMHQSAPRGAFLCRNKWGPQRTNFGARCGFSGYYKLR